jgi:phosphatidate cytidylyltransferase
MVPAHRYVPEGGHLDPSVAGTVYFWGGLVVVTVLSTVWICDTAAYHVGKAIGRHKLFPRVSPKKSVEGAVAGFIAAIGAALAAKFLLLGWLGTGQAVTLGVIVGVAGQAGDLFESLLKRDAEVKDSSGFLPGHGGVLDRFDSLLIVSPVAYLYLDFIVLT